MFSRKNAEKETETWSSTNQLEPTRRRSAELSPSALRKKYLPRNGGPGHPAPHPAATAAAAGAQKKHPQPPNGSEGKTENASATHRNIRLTRFKPGFEQQTEYEISVIFCRPMRTYKEDPPFYPWLPPEPKVNFNLNYNG